MKRWRYLALALTLSSSAVFANSMKSNFDEGRAYGGTANGNAQNVMKKFSSEQIMPNAGSPEQAKLYTGQNSNPNLGAMGIQALSNTEVGQILTQSSINNPADTISTESDMLKRSDEIVNNAHYLTGGISGKQCIKQSLSKSHFTNHFCEKEQAIDAVCKITAKVNWIGTKGKKIYHYDFNIPFLPLTDATADNFFGFSVGGNGVRTKTNRSGYFHFEFSQSIPSPIEGKVGVLKDLTINFKNKQPLVPIGYQVYVSNYGNLFPQGKQDLDKEWFSESNLLLRLMTAGTPMNGLTINSNYFSISGILYFPSFSWQLPHYAIEGDYFHISYNLEVEEDSLKPEVVYENSCSAKVDDNAIKLTEQCTQAGGIRRVSKDGKDFEVSADCWEKTEKYLVSEASDNECKRYDNDRNCTVGERECLSSENGLCTRFRLKYQCQHITKTEGVVCGDKFFCSDGSCADLNGSVNADFGHAVSQLASLAQAGKDISLDAQNLRAFSGRPIACRKSGFGFSDCCKDSGWGHKAGIAHCNSEENVLGKAKEKNTVIYVGTYCSKKVLRHCVQRKSTYCVFDSKLARIIQYQGRSGQLGVGFGGAQNPDCRGLTVDELQRLNFNAMDYSDFYSELQENTKIPNQDKIVDFIQKNIAGQLQQKQQ